MCKLRANIVKNCRKCKSSVRPNCSIRRKTTRKMYLDSKSRKRE